MKSNSRTARILLSIGVLMLALAPGTALAHDNLGGDELAMSNLMFIGAMIVIVMGIIAGIWAWQAGQFNNIEESKYRMLEIADDYDAVMAEIARSEAGAASQPSGPGVGMKANAQAPDTALGKSGPVDGPARA
ncbi:MAG TPA: cbb3-type cytochrome oxidase assembly protein [Chloroflexia bacterium]|nr:cbb3-type cytochrome oxidase assembly protein [Chloroflexia bacterium]